MTYDEAVTKLLGHLKGDFQKFESNEQLNGFNRYEFVVTKLNGVKKMIQVGEDIVEKQDPIS